MTEDLLLTARARVERMNAADAAFWGRLLDAYELKTALHAELFSKMANQSQNFLDAERYRWLRDGSFDVPCDVIAPAVVNCSQGMETFVWLIGKEMDNQVDYWMGWKG